MNICLISLKTYNIALETYDLADFKDIMKFLKKKFHHFKTNERKCTGEEKFFALYEGEIYNYNTIRFVNSIKI